MFDGRNEFFIDSFVLYFIFSRMLAVAGAFLSLSLSQNSVREKTVNVSPLLWSFDLKCIIHIPNKKHKNILTNCCWRSFYLLFLCVFCSSFFELFLFENRMLQWSRNDATCSLCIRTVVLMCNKNHIANITGEVERWTRSTWNSVSSLLFFFFFDKLLYCKFVFLFDLIIRPLDHFLSSCSFIRAEKIPNFKYQIQINCDL